MDRNFIKTDTVISDPGYFTLPGVSEPYRDWKAHGTATMGLRGQRIQPHLLSRIRTSKGEWISATPQPLTSMTLKHPEHFTPIIDGMRGVVEYGTGGRYGRGKPFKSAGKTGTAQVFSIRNKSKSYMARIPDHLKDHSLFIVFAPIEDPQIAVAVIAENSPGYAPTVAKSIVDHYLIGPKTKQAEGSP